MGGYPRGHAVDLSKSGKYVAFCFMDKDHTIRYCLLSVRLRHVCRAHNTPIIHNGKPCRNARLSAFRAKYERHSFPISLGGRLEGDTPTSLRIWIEVPSLASRQSDEEITQIGSVNHESTYRAQIMFSAPCLSNVNSHVKS